jgi:hypothetical protein
MTARERMINTLRDAGVDEAAAGYALPAMPQWLLRRAEHLRAGGLYGDAVWFARVANEPVS